MSDFFAPSQQSKFGVHRHWKLVNPQKRLNDRMRHLVEVAGLAEAVSTSLQSQYTADGKPVGCEGVGSCNASFAAEKDASIRQMSHASSAKMNIDHATEDQREAYVFYHHHAHLIFIVYRLYLRSFLIPSSVSQNDLPLVDVLSLLQVPAAVATTLSSAVSAVPIPSLVKEGPAVMVKRLVGDSNIRTITSNVPSFLALSPSFYCHTGVVGLGLGGASTSPSDTSGSNNGFAQSNSGKTMTPLEALGAASVLRQIVMALAADFATLLPFGERVTAAPFANQKASSPQPKTVIEAIAPYPSAHVLLLRYQLLLAVIFEVQQLAQPDNDYAVRRVGYDLLVRIYSFRMAGCLVPNAQSRAPFSKGPAARGAQQPQQQNVSSLAVEHHSESLDLLGGLGAVKCKEDVEDALPQTQNDALNVACAQATLEARKAFESAEVFLNDTNYDGVQSKQDPSSSEASSLGAIAHTASFSALNGDERLLISLIDWDYFIETYSDGSTVVPTVCTEPLRNPNLPSDCSKALSLAEDVGCLMPHTYHTCFSPNPAAQQREGTLEIVGSGHSAGTASSFTLGSALTAGFLSTPAPEQPRADRGRESLAMLQLLIEAPLRAGSLARKAVTPSMFPYAVIPNNTVGASSVFCALNIPLFRSVMAEVHASLRERWWSLLRRTVVRLFYPAAFFEAFFHHEAQALPLSPSPSGAATVVKSSHSAFDIMRDASIESPNTIVPYYREGFRNGPHPLVHALIVDSMCHVYNNGRSLVVGGVNSTASTANHAAFAGAFSEIDLSFQQRRMPAVIESLQQAIAACEDATEPYPPAAPRVLKCLASRLGQDLRLIALLCLSSLADGGMCSGGDISDVISPLACPPKVIVKSQGLLLDMLRRPHSVLLAYEQATTSWRAFPLSDYLGAFIEGSFLMLSTPTMCRARTATDASLEKGLAIVTDGSVSLEKATFDGCETVSLQSEGGAGFLTFLNVLQRAADWGFPRSQASCDVIQDALRQAKGKEEGKVLQSLAASFSDPAASNVFNYKAFYASEDNSARRVLPIPLAGIHCLVTTRVQQAITAPSATIQSAATTTVSQASPSQITPADVCAQIEALAELFHAIATCDAEREKRVGSSAVRLTSTRVKHAAVHSLAALVCEVAVLGQHGSSQARATMSDALAYANQCLWASCASRVDGAWQSDSQNADLVAAPYDPSTFAKLVVPFIKRVLDPCLQAKGQPTFGGLRPCDDTVHPTMGSTLPLPLIIDTWGAIAARTIISSWQIPLKDTQKIGPQTAAVFGPCALVTQTFAWPSTNSFASPTGGLTPVYGTLLTNYRNRRLGIPTEGIRVCISNASNLLGGRDVLKSAVLSTRVLLVDERVQELAGGKDSLVTNIPADKNSQFRIGFSALEIFFEGFATDSLCVQQHKGAVLCALVGFAGKARRAAIDPVPSSSANASSTGPSQPVAMPSGLTLLATFLPYLGQVAALRGGGESVLLPIAVEASARIAELIALPPASGDGDKQTASVIAEDVLALYASAVGHLRTILPLPSSLVRYIDANVKSAGAIDSAKPPAAASAGLASHHSLSSALSWVHAADLSDTTAQHREQLLASAASSPSKITSSPASPSSQQGQSFTPAQSAHVFAYALATAVSRSITPRTDTSDELTKRSAASSLVNSGAGLSDGDINSLLAGQRIMQELCRSNTLGHTGPNGATPGHLGRPTPSLLTTDYDLQCPSASVRAPLMPMLLDAACLSLLLAPITSQYDATQDHEDAILRESTYSAPAYPLLTAAKGSASVVSAKVTKGCQLSRRALSLFHDVQNKKVSCLGIIEWAITDLAAMNTHGMAPLAAPTSETQASSPLRGSAASPAPSVSQHVANRRILYKIVSVLEASVHTAGAGGLEYPMAHIARVLAKVAALVLTPTTSTESFPIDVTLATRVINVSMLLWSDPQVLRKDPRFIGVFASTLDTIASSIVSLFRLACVSRYEGVRRTIEGLYSRFLTSICATIFFYNHDTTWGVSESMLAGALHSGGANPPPSNPSSSSPAAPSSNGDASLGAGSAPLSRGGGAAESPQSVLSQQMRRFSVARQTVASSSASACLIECSIALLLVATRLAESVQRLWLPISTSSLLQRTPTCRCPPSLRQLLVDVVHLLNHGRTSIDYWVKPLDISSAVPVAQTLTARLRPLLFAVNEVPSQENTEALDGINEEDRAAEEMSNAVRSTLLSHLSQIPLREDSSGTQHLAKRLGDEVMRLADIRIGRKHAPSSAASKSEKSEAAGRSHVWLYVGTAKRTIAQKRGAKSEPLVSSSSTSPIDSTRRSKEDVASPYGKYLSATRAVVQEIWVKLEEGATRSGEGEPQSGPSSSSPAAGQGGNTIVSLKCGSTFRTDCVPISRTSLLALLQEAELFLAELAAATVRAVPAAASTSSSSLLEEAYASANQSSTAMGRAIEGAGAQFFGISMIPVAGRPCVLCPWIHMSSVSPTFESHLLQRFESAADSSSTSSPAYSPEMTSLLSHVKASNELTRRAVGQPICVALEKLHSLVDELQIRVGERDSKDAPSESSPSSSLSAFNITFSTALCRGTLPLHFASSLLRRTLEDRGGQLVGPEQMLSHVAGNSQDGHGDTDEGVVLTTLKANASGGGESTLFIGSRTRASCGDGANESSAALRIVSANGRGATAFTITAARGSTLADDALHDPEQQTKRVALPIKISAKAAKVRTKLDFILGDFGKGLHVPCARSNTADGKQTSSYLTDKIACNFDTRLGELIKTRNSAIVVANEAAALVSSNPKETQENPKESSEAVRGSTPAMKLQSRTGVPSLSSSLTTSSLAQSFAATTLKSRSPAALSGGGKTAELSEEARLEVRLYGDLVSSTDKVSALVSRTNNETSVMSKDDAHAYVSQLASRRAAFLHFKPMPHPFHAKKGDGNLLFDFVSSVLAPHCYGTGGSDTSSTYGQAMTSVGRVSAQPLPQSRSMPAIQSHSNRIQSLRQNQRVLIVDSSFVGSKAANETSRIVASFFRDVSEEGKEGRQASGGEAAGNLFIPSSVSSPQNAFGIGFVAAVASARSSAELESILSAAVSVGCEGSKSTNTLPTVFVVCVVDSFTPLVEEVNRRFAKSNAATIVFLQPLSERGGDTSCVSAVMTHILRCGFGPHLAPLQDATIIPMADTNGVTSASPLASLVRAAALGTASRSAPANFTCDLVSQSPIIDSPQLRVEFTQAFPSALRVTAASDLHNLAVGELLTKS